MPNIPAPAWSAPWTADDRCTRFQSQQAELDLAAWLNGAPHVAFDAFRKILEPISDDLYYFLEVGSGAGYGMPVLHSFSPKTCYWGIDISPHMVKYAESRYNTHGDWTAPIFCVGTANNLEPHRDGDMDCVCLAAVIQHLPDYRPALAEAVRVSRKYVLIHRLEGTSEPTFDYVNEAYDTRLPTKIINEQELLAECESRGLTLVATERWGANDTRWNCSLLFEKEN